MGSRPEQFSLLWLGQIDHSNQGLRRKAMKFTTIKKHCKHFATALVGPLCFCLATGESIGETRHWVNQENFAFYENGSAWVPEGIPNGADAGALFGQQIEHHIGLLSDHQVNDLTVANQAKLSFGPAGGVVAGERLPDRTYATNTASVSNATFELDSSLNSPDSSDVFLTVDETLNVDGELNVRDGSRVNANTMTMGTGEFPVVAVTRVTGRDAHNGPSQLVTDSLTVGSQSKAEMYIQDGAVVTTQTGIVGQRQGLADDAINQVQLAHGSNWNVTDLTVGLSGRGLVFPQFGSRINSTSITLGTAIGNEPEDLGFGEATIVGYDVNGRPSTVNTDSLVLGDRGTGIFHMEDGAHLNAGDVVIAPNGGSVGRLTMFSGPNEPASISNVTNVFVGGTSEERGGRGRLEVKENSEMRVNEVKIWPESAVTVEGGTLSADRMVNEGGLFDMTFGKLQVGEYVGNNLIMRGGTFAPGPGTSSSTVRGGFTQQSANNVMEIEIGGTSAGESFDHVTVEGIALVDGNLNLDLVDGFTPSATDKFAVMTSLQVAGAFDNVLWGERLATADGTGSFIVNYGASSEFGIGNVVLSDFVLLTTTIGDFDGDGMLTASDIDLLSAAVGGADLKFDLTDDGIVDQLDREFWVEDVKGTYFGDANLDQSVEFRDFLGLANRFGTKSSAGWADGDFDGDGDVAFRDFLLQASNFGKVAASAEAAAVPEPSGAMLALLFGLAGLIGYRRRR